MSYNSKYKGTEVEELLDSIGNKADKTDLTSYYNKEQTNELLDEKANVISIPTKLSELENDVPYIAEHQDISHLATKLEISDMLTKTEANTIYQPIGDYALKSDLSSIDLNIFKVVNELPTIDINPDKIYLMLSSEYGERNVYTEYAYVNNAWEILGEYSTNIDLSTYLLKTEAESMYLTKADANLTYATKDDLSSNTLDEVYISNGVVPEDDAVSLWVDESITVEEIEYLTLEEADALYQLIGDYQLTISDLDEIREGASKGATALQEHQDISGKQDTLISGNNIKTINGESLLGEGNILIEGGGGSVEIPIIEHGENDTTITIESNTYHKWGEVRELTISLGEPANLGVVNEYMFSFTNMSLAPRLTIDELMWEHGEYPEFTFLAKNVVKIMDGLAKIESFALSSIVLSDELDLEEQEQAMQLYNIIESGEYSPGEYSTNGASIYVYVYLETEYRYIYERVIYFGIPVGFPSYPLNVHTESGRQFYLTYDGILYLS